MRVNIFNFIVQQIANWSESYEVLKEGRLQAPHPENIG